MWNLNHATSYLSQNACTSQKNSEVDGLINAVQKNYIAGMV